MEFGGFLESSSRFLLPSTFLSILPLTVHSSHYLTVTCLLIVFQTDGPARHGTGTARTRHG
jgi:hypothetical protein